MMMTTTLWLRLSTIIIYDNMARVIAVIYAKMLNEELWHIIECFTFQTLNEDDECEDKEIETEEELKKKEAYLAACQDLSSRVSALEQIQVEILKVLLCNTDHNKVRPRSYCVLYNGYKMVRLSYSKVVIVGHYCIRLITRWGQGAVV